MNDARKTLPEVVDWHLRLLPGVPLVDSPFFDEILASEWFDPDERDVARQLHEHGFAIIDFPDPAFDATAGRIIGTLDPLFQAALDDEDRFGGNLMPPRFQDAQQACPEVGTLADNAALKTLLGKLYGRAPFPFQTLVFRQGSQQHVHTDAVHFNSWPKNFMCGVWVALEDVTDANGPLVYHPGSHHWAVYDNDLTVGTTEDVSRPASQAAFHDLWDRLIEAKGSAPAYFHPKKGQALIWAANLLHGGALIEDRDATRWSQVTHYFFDNCAWYRPMASHIATGSIAFVDTKNVATGEAQVARYGQVELPADLLEASRQRTPPGYSEAPLPPDFDPDRYLELNPDVAAAGADPVGHYTFHGRLEGRRYR